MVKCEVAGCGNYRNRPAMDGEIRFFSFPSEPNRRLAWRLAAGCSSNAVLTGKQFVCSKHFLESAYHMKEKIMGLPFNTWKLDKSAVPTEFLPESAVITSESSKHSERQAKRSRIILVEDLLRDDEEKENEVERSEVMDTSSDNETLTLTEEEIPETFTLTSKCRLCLAELDTDSGELINIFAVDDRDTSTIAKWVADHLNVELDDSPEYPSLICRCCSDNIQLIETFRNAIINSQSYFSDEIPPLVHVDVEMIDMVDDKTDADDSQSSCIVEEEKGQGDSEDAANETSELSEKPTQRMINCTQCQGSFSSRKELKQHKATHSADDRRIYSCSYCPKNFNKPEGLRRHIHRIHEKVQRCVCEVCGKAFTSLGSLWDHKQQHKKKKKNLGQQKKNRKRSHASEEGINLGEFTYCSICKKGVANIRFHSKSVHGEEYQPTEFDLELVPCKYCGEQVKRISMTGHYNGKHRRKRLVCEFCQEEFKRYTTYQVHLDRHLNRKYPCMYCEKVNETQQGRYLHIRYHHPDKYVVQVAKQKSYGMVKEDAEEN